MEVSSQDPSLMAMDLSKSYKPLTCNHTEAMDLVKKPEWYHRRPSSCSTDITPSYRTRASSSYNSLATQTGAPVLCRDMEQDPEVLGTYMNSTRAPALDLYHDRVHGNLWHSGFYGPDQSCGPDPESSCGEESDSGSDVIFLVSSAKEPLLCSPFIQESVRHIVEPLSPNESSLDESRGCYHLPQPMSSPSPDCSYSEDSSDSSVDIPIHHTRPVVLLSELSAVYNNRAESPVDISSDESDVIEVSASDDKKKSSSFNCKKNVPCKKLRETTPQSQRQGEKAGPREVRRSSRIRKSISEMPPFTCSVSRNSLRRQVKNDAVGIYNESCDSDNVMEYAVRLSSSEADESASQPNASGRVCTNSEESDADTQTKTGSPRRHQQRKNMNQKRKGPLSDGEAKTLRRTVKRQKKSVKLPKPSSCQKALANKSKVNRRKRKRRPQPGPSARFPVTEPEIKLRYANIKGERRDKKVDGFCPFVHMEQRTCTVVNFQEEATLWSSRGRRQLTSPPGFLPSTSCFQLGRLGSESRCHATLLCCLCGQTANATGLGDLHGPYYPAISPGNRRSSRAEQKDGGSARGLADGGCDGPDGSDNGYLQSNSHSLPKVPLCLHECWIHEDCGIWSAGIFLVRGKLYGLEEAARLAQETVCSSCQQTGAIMGCFQKGCSRNYHYRCAISSGCILSEENFSMRCPEHKNRPFTSVSKLHQR
ncbi:uncharacterized protein LOC114860428 [Betta splendens]|uniref:Uncharacterized protein LOC114860428 n=1 Tax=Betta splendens TaxID=158456 RepID=A0A6P7N946_BETSP|nr:uncharacterized protein LOC114860428 [Betta splendens]XP_055366722.1 uncharacterized protein LOC114860428 [Betta splendens]